MNLMQGLLNIIVNLLDTLLASLNLPDNFYYSLDSAISFFISLFEGASYFLPLDLFVLSFGVMLIVDNWSIIVRIVQYLLRLIRG